MSSLALACVLVEPPPVQRPKSMGPVPPSEPAPSVPTPSEPTPSEPAPSVPVEPSAPSPSVPVEPSAPPEPPIAAPTITPPRSPGSPPVLPAAHGPAIAPAELGDPVAPLEPPTTSDPFAGSPPPPRDPTARATVDPFTDAPHAPARDGKAVLYGGLALSGIAMALRVPVSTKLVRGGNPYDAMVFGNLVNVVAIAGITTLSVGAVRRAKSIAYDDVFERHERRFNAKAMTIAGWSMFTVGLATFVLSRVLTPVTCDLVNQCDFRALEATWYVSFGLVAAGAGLGSFGLAYGDRATTYEQQRKRVAITPLLDRTRAGLGISGRF